MEGYFSARKIAFIEWILLCTDVFSQASFSSAVQVLLADLLKVGKCILKLQRYTSMPDVQLSIDSSGEGSAGNTCAPKQGSLQEDMQ